jgi:poly-gamma-glutamate capsule biosynthesis protein CapA/YwtB (metallophosphatase superfamily)
MRAGAMKAAMASLVLAIAAYSHAPAGPPRPVTAGGTSRGTIVIHATGDVSLDPAQIPTFRAHGYGWAWSGLDGLFRTDDLTIVNLECPATDVVAPVLKAFTFRCDPSALPATRAAGVDVVSQANNHAYDEGPAGLLDSLGRIRGAGLFPVGAGADREEALRAAIFQLDGWNVAVVGIDQILDPPDEVAGPGKPGTAVGHDFGLGLRAVRAAAAISDVVVVAIHWGVELEANPRSFQIVQAHRLVDAGADMIFGGHAHRLQPFETYRGAPIFYSLGNFVWPRLGPDLRATAVAEVTLRPDGEVQARLLPAEIVSDGHPKLVSGPGQIVAERTPVAISSNTSAAIASRYTMNSRKSWRRR